MYNAYCSAFKRKAVFPQMRCKIEKSTLIEAPKAV